MATFHIHQDAGKENPNHHMPLKEKTHGIGIKSNVLQPSSIIAAGGGPFKETKVGRTVLSHNINTNGNGTAGGARIVNSSKVAFRDVGNGTNKVATITNDENVASKKSTAVVPVVEQFKSFTVYEDQGEIVDQQQQQQKQRHSENQQTAITATSSFTNILIDKENVYIDQLKQQQRIHIKSDSILNEFGTSAQHDDDYILDTTPMSVSDVLSPMSVDRSHILHSSSSKKSNSLATFDDGSNSKEVAEQQQLQQQQKKSQQQLSRNDRQRFFEVIEYQRDILEYFRESELKHRPKPHYMKRQVDINYSMRTILVDWLVEVSEEYNLDTETLYLSVSYIDRFLSHMSVVRSKLQLVGTAAMYIASKYEEIYPPDVGEFVFITDDTYNKAQVMRMEQIILKILSFDLCTPTAYVFINTYSVLCDMPDKLKYLTQYICELSLLEAEPYLRFYPSTISAAAMALARCTLDYPIWSVELEEITSYSLEELKEMVLSLCKSHNGALKLDQQAIQEKYKVEKYKQVSTIKPIELNEELYDEIVRNYNKSNMERKLNASTATAAASAAASSTEAQETATTATNNENLRRMISLMFN